MEKYRRNTNSDELVEKEVVAPVSKPTYNYSVRQVQSLVDARIIYNGAVTGKRYEWARAGAIVPVDERDVPELLAKRLGGRSCCGPQDGNKIFELI